MHINNQHGFGSRTKTNILSSNEEHIKHAPGGPGVDAHWKTGAKSGIGKSMNTASDVTFTISQGIVNEVFYPREDIACLNSVEFVVTDGKAFISKEETDTTHKIEWLDEGVPGYLIRNHCKSEKFTIEKTVIADPIRSTLLQEISLLIQDAQVLKDLKLHVLVRPHIRNRGMGNTGWKGRFKGVPMLFASRDSTVIAVACSEDFVRSSVGFAGVSDGYTELEKHKNLTETYDRAEDGNLVLSAEIDLSTSRKLLVAVGFGHSEQEAANNARSSILDGFDIAKAKFVFEWQRWQRSLASVKSHWNTLGRDFRKSAAVLMVHESRKVPGGIIASLSKPWGQVKGDDQTGGYHLVWPRDLALSAGGFLELNAKDDVLRILNFMMTVQEDDGCWSQNMWLEGSPYWTGIQMDQIALPVLLLGAAYQKSYVSGDRCRRYWPQVKKALQYIITHGPYTQQDRWEEEQGLTTFTLASQIAALLTGAFLAKENHDPVLASFCMDTADFWNQHIETWTYVTDTDTSRKLGIDGYYMRINPYHEPAQDVKNKTIHLKNHQDGEGVISLGELVSVDALALVRFGLRDANDPRIVNTIRVIDAKLKVETPTGPCWHRYNLDGYGEDAAGNPYEGHGIGRAWPLLTGERAHYEIAAGNFDRAEQLLKTMESFANNSLLPEQIWDTEDIPEKGLFLGKATGSAMPLTWAHAEYLKLCASIKHKRIVDMPAFTSDRYIKKKTRVPLDVWQFSHQISRISTDHALRIQLQAAAIVRWSDDGWKTFHETETFDTGVGIHVVDIQTKNSGSDRLDFTFFWTSCSQWENKNFSVDTMDSL